MLKLRPEISIFLQKISQKISVNIRLSNIYKHFKVGRNLMLLI